MDRIPTAFDKTEEDKLRADEEKAARNRAMKATAICFYDALKNEEFHSRLRVLLEVEAPTDPRMGELQEQINSGLRNAYAVIMEQYRRGEQILAQRGDLP